MFYCSTLVCVTEVRTLSTDHQSSPVSAKRVSSGRSFFTWAWVRCMAPGRETLSPSSACFSCASVKVRHPISSSRRTLICFGHTPNQIHSSVASEDFCSRHSSPKRSLNFKMEKPRHVTVALSVSTVLASVSNTRASSSPPPSFPDMIVRVRACVCVRMRVCTGANKIEAMFLFWCSCRIENAQQRRLVRPTQAKTRSAVDTRVRSCAVLTRV